MNTSDLPPWATGPAEILEHGLDLLTKESDSNRRLAMISIDNSVELMIKTYLGLPKRVTGFNISRSEYQSFSESFPRLLDALEKYGASNLGFFDLGEVEWYHRLRNQLYHQGNGLTVEREKVEVYAQIAAALFESLFDVKLTESSDDDYYLLAEFINTWSKFERATDDLSSFYQFDENTNLRTTVGYAGELYRNKYLSKSEFYEIRDLWKKRNQVVHGRGNFREIVTADMIQRLVQITQAVLDRIDDG